MKWVHVCSYHRRMYKLIRFDALCAFYCYKGCLDFTSLTNKAVEVSDSFNL